MKLFTKSAKFYRNHKLPLILTITMLVIVGTLSINIYRHHQNSESIAGTAKTEVQEQDVSYIATKTKEVEADQAIKPENQSVSDEPEAAPKTSTPKKATPTTQDQNPSPSMPSMPTITPTNRKLNISPSTIHLGGTNPTTAYVDVSAVDGSSIGPAGISNLPSGIMAYDFGSGPGYSYSSSRKTLSITLSTNTITGSGTYTVTTPEGYSSTITLYWEPF